MTWLIGPKRLSNSSRQVAPAMIGEITTGRTSSAMNICRPGIRSRNRKASSRPSTSSIGRAMREEQERVQSACQKRPSASSRE